jgi:hypothetical protein
VIATLASLTGIDIAFIGFALAYSASIVIRALRSRD